MHLCLDLREPASQTLQVSMRWTPSNPRLTWQLPVWTPGSYTVRDPSQHLHSLSLHQGDRRLHPTRLSPSRWSIDLQSLEAVCLRYRIEARQLTVRTCHLDPEFASLCLSAVAMEVGGFRWEPHTLEILHPDAWRAFVPLPTRNGRWVADDFDQLVDSPVHAGDLNEIPFQVNGCRHSLLLIGSPPMDWPRSLVDDIEGVCAAACKLMGGDPPAGNRYQLVIQMLDQGYGGLEHDHGAVLQFSWPLLAKADGYRQLLQLVGHEYLHQWNVRRLRPKEYVPYDHGRPVISDGLWFAEGITSYFDLALPLLAGQSDRTTLLSDLAKDLSHVLLNPGRTIQSLADSSREAWVRLYKSTPAGAQTQISYYKLGTALAFCLDVELRAAGSSLASVLRELWTRFGPNRRGYGRSDIQDIIRETNAGLADRLDHWLDETDSLPIEACVRQLGLSLVPAPGQMDSTGLTLLDSSRGVVIKQVSDGSPGQQAQLVAGDELVAVRGHRLYSADQWPSLIKGESTMSITYARRGRLEETRLIQMPPEHKALTLEWNPQASDHDKTLRDQWFEIL